MDDDEQSLGSLFEDIPQLPRFVPPTNKQVRDWIRQTNGRLTVEMQNRRMSARDNCKKLSELLTSICFPNARHVGDLVLEYVVDWISYNGPLTIAQQFYIWDDLWDAEPPRVQSCPFPAKQPRIGIEFQTVVPGNVRSTRRRMRCVPRPRCLRESMLNDVL